MVFVYMTLYQGNHEALRNSNMTSIFYVRESSSRLQLAFEEDVSCIRLLPLVAEWHRCF